MVLMFNCLCCCISSSWRKHRITRVTEPHMLLWINTQVACTNLRIQHNSELMEGVPGEQNGISLDRSDDVLHGFTPLHAKLVPHTAEKEARAVEMLRL